MHVMQMQHILLHPLYIYLPVKRTTYPAQNTIENVMVVTGIVLF